MFDLEGFAAAHQRAIELFGVLGTFVAVVVSLVFGYLAYRGRRTNFRAVAYETVHFVPIEQGYRKKRVFVIAITNLGELPLSVSDDFFWIGMRFSNRTHSIIPPDATPLFEEESPGRYPVTIEPRKTAHLMICDRDSFVWDCRNLARAHAFLGRVRVRLVQIKVFTEDGVTRTARMAWPLRSLILGKTKRHGSRTLLGNEGRA